MRTLNLAPLHRATVGFDQITDMMDRIMSNDTNNQTYPPYNIEKTADDGWRISIAVAGFSEEDLNVEVKENALHITANKAEDADAALQELGSDHVGLALVTATVAVWDEDASLAAEKLRLAEKVIQGRDFTCVTEGMNAIEAWLGSLPGHVYANVCQPPISTLNLAHILPLSAVWAGPDLSLIPH